MTNLVIVESPTKARTLSRFLGKKFQIEASMGHIRDLPKSELGIDIEKNFEPKYIIPRDKKKRVNELKKLAEHSQVLWLATDPDREGEAIAWHLAHILKIDDGGSKMGVGNRRVVFHEITKEAIEDAFKHPRNIDFDLVNAQQGRRVLDRLVGYTLSPLLWKKIKKGLSAGRVQTVALRLIVEREREIEKFKPEEYWSIEAELESTIIARGPVSSPPPANSFLATLVEFNGQKLEIHNQKDADQHTQSLQNASYAVSKVAQKEVRKYSQPPFITSTLQQASGNKLGFSAKKTMMLAQNLYEHGLITYMRTDSLNLSTFAINSIRLYIQNSIGKSYLPNTPRVYKSKSKLAQEAHEAIRPTNIKTDSLSLKKNGLTKDHARLYDLIRKRTLASQMEDAIFDQTTVDVEAGNYLLRATGSVLKFDGWLKIYGIKNEGEGEEQENKNQLLPILNEGEKLNLLQVLPKQHFSEPPPRYTEASLIKKLEELGIGRPSTYAPTLSTIQERFYVEKEQKKFKPTNLGLSVNDFLIKHFPEVFDYHFTALMEDQLDEVAHGNRQWEKIIGDFYHPFEKKVEVIEEKAERVKLELEFSDKLCPKCGKNLVIRIGRFGKFLACSGFPECKHTESFEQKIDAKCPQDGGEVVLRKTKKGRTFYGCKNWPNCKFASWTKPKSEKAP